jgi:hypothetical protein
MLNYQCSSKEKSTIGCQSITRTLNIEHCKLNIKLFENLHLWD